MIGEPMGVRDQDWFLNCAAEAKTNLEPGELLSLIQSIESKLGRAPAVPNGPRTIDVDILFYGSQIVEQDALIIPHPRLHERSFVLAPLAEIRPYFPHPVLGRTVAQLLSSLTEPGKWERVEEPPILTSS